MTNNLFNHSLAFLALVIERQHLVDDIGLAILFR